MTTPVIVTRSKVRRAVLRLGGTAPDYADGAEFACDMTNIAITPDASEDGEAVELACGTIIPAPLDSSFTLDGSGIQRFDEPDRFQAFCYSHHGQTLGFYFKPNDVGPTFFTGQIVVVAVGEGGDVGNDAGDMSWSFNGVGWYVRTPPGAPAITGVDPATGPAAGGTPVTITGTNLANATGVLFGGVAGTAFAVAGDELTVTTPPHAAGAVDVTVQLPVANVTQTAAFTYTA